MAQRDNGNHHHQWWWWWWFRHMLREARHNPWVMNPVATLLLLLVICMSTALLVLRIPTFILGLVLMPFMKRFDYIMEFLYPTTLGRWIHFFLLNLVKRTQPRATGGGSGGTTTSTTEDKNRGQHSRTVESRIEVIAGRVYIHPLPQLLDNVGYLVVCCPGPTIVTTSMNQQQQGTTTTTTSSLSTGPLGRLSSVVTTTTSLSAAVVVEPRIVALVVDCGDAAAVSQQIQYISDFHYQSQPIELQAILSTHKHHDHTAGNVGLVNHPLYGSTIKYVFGGAVERVPCCNYPVADGDEIVPLPKSSSCSVNSSMEDLVRIKGAVATTLRHHHHHQEYTCLQVTLFFLAVLVYHLKVILVTRN
jgi:hypothetical protein